MFRGKKYQESAKLIDKAALYDTAEAMELVVKTAPAKFDETVELHVKLGVDSRHADQQVRGAIVLPHGTGKTQRVLVFAKGDKAEAAKAEAIRRAEAEAERTRLDAQAQAQAIIDEAVNEANGIRQASINYTDDMLNSLQTIITHSMEGAQSRFDAFISSMQSSYDIVSSNRGELAGSVTNVEETPEEEPVEEQ